MSANQAIKTQGTTLEIDSDGSSPYVYTAVGDIQSFSGPGGQAAEIDVTHMGSTAKEFLQGLPDNGELTISGNFAGADDAGQVAMRTARTAQALRHFRLTFVNADVWTFDGFVYSFSLSGQQDSKWDFSATIRVSGAIAEA